MTEMVHAEETWRDRKGPNLPRWPEQGDKTVGPALGTGRVGCSWHPSHCQAAASEEGIRLPHRVRGQHDPQLSSPSQGCPANIRLQFLSPDPEALP